MQTWKPLKTWLSTGIIPESTVRWRKKVNIISTIVDGEEIYKA